MRLGMVGALGALGALAGCSGENPFKGCPEEAPVLELGTGERELILLDDGDTATIVMGGQGGFHVDGAGRISPFPQSVIVTGTLSIPSAPGAPEVGRGMTNVALANYDDDLCYGEFWGLQLRMTQENSSLGRVSQMNGRDGVIEITVEDLDGIERLTESVTVRLRWDP